MSESIPHASAANREATRQFIVLVLILAFVVALLIAVASFAYIRYIRAAETKAAVEQSAREAVEAEVQMRRQREAVKIASQKDREVRMAREQAETLLAASVNRSLLGPRTSLIVVIGADNQPAWAFMDAVANRLGEAKHDVQSRALTAAFYGTPLANELVSEGPANVLPKLRVDCERVIIGRMKVVANSPNQYGFITTDCVGSLTVFTPAGRVVGTLSYSSAGAAINPDASSAAALVKAQNAIDWERLNSLLTP